MRLIFQIAVGVVIGGLVLMWLQRRYARKAQELERRRKAYELGQKHGQAVADAITSQTRRTLSHLQERLLGILSQRIEQLAVLDETIEEQQERNRAEVTDLRQTAQEAEKLVWQDRSAIKRTGCVTSMVLKNAPLWRRWFVKRYYLGVSSSQQPLCSPSPKRGSASSNESWLMEITPSSEWNVNGRGDR